MFFYRKLQRILCVVADMSYKIAVSFAVNEKTGRPMPELFFGRKAVHVG